MAIGSWWKTPEAMHRRDWKHKLFRLTAGLFNHSSALQKQNEEQQRHYQNLIDDLQAMANAIPDAALVIDRKDLVTWSNDPAKQLLDLKTHANQGQAITRLIREPGFADWLAVQDTVHSKLEIPCPTDDSIPLQISVTKFGKDQRLLILRDITDAESLDRIRRDFIANISHEMRTPLTVLLGYLELLQDQPDKLDPKTYDRYMKLLRKLGGLAVVEVENEICLGCNTNIPPQLYNDIIKGEDVYTCFFCNRLLYYKDDTPNSSSQEVAQASNDREEAE